MLDCQFPQNQSNTYRGHPIAKWVFISLTIITIARSLVQIFASDGGAQTIVNVPLDSLTANSANAVVLVFALWGLSQLLIGIYYGSVLSRYQVLIPLIYPVS